MSIRTFALALTAAASFAALSTASAAVMVVGTGPERACYEAAKADRATGATIKTCTEALDNSMLTPRDRAATFTNRSALYISRERAANALKDADEALTIEPSMTAASVNRSAALIMLGRYEEARSTIDAAIPLASGGELQRALYNRAMASEALGDIKGAYYDLKRAVDLDPKFEAARIELARYQVHSK
jgi:tetratricopeptide (TPR) repeat protein